MLSYLVFLSPQLSHSDTDGREDEEESTSILYAEQTEVLTNSLPEQKVNDGSVFLYFWHSRNYWHQNLSVHTGTSLVGASAGHVCRGHFFPQIRYRYPFWKLNLELNFSSFLSRRYLLLMHPFCLYFPHYIFPISCLFFPFSLLFPLFFIFSPSDFLDHSFLAHVPLTWFVWLAGIIPHQF
jgi:hypothetical protein